MSNYETGRRLEYRVRDIFRKQGFLVIRAAQSKPIDLVCIRDGKLFLVECKAGGSFLGQDRKKELLGLSEQARAPVIIARRKKRHIELTNLIDNRPMNPENLLGSMPL